MRKTIVIEGSVYLIKPNHYNPKGYIKDLCKIFEAVFNTYTLELMDVRSYKYPIGSIQLVLTHDHCKVKGIVLASWVVDYESKGYNWIASCSTAIERILDNFQPLLFNKGAAECSSKLIEIAKSLEE